MATTVGVGEYGAVAFETERVVGERRGVGVKSAAGGGTGITVEVVRRAD
jgi:hypothetical protein